jgi:hypothetical protein
VFAKGIKDLEKLKKNETLSPRPSTEESLRIYLFIYLAFVFTEGIIYIHTVVISLILCMVKMYAFNKNVDIKFSAHDT